jgi:hypothetical protein
MDEIKKREELEILQNQNSFKIFKYVQKRIEKKLPKFLPNFISEIGFYFFLEILISYTITVTIGWVYCSYFQTYFLNKFGLKIYGQNYYLNGSLIKHTIAPVFLEICSKIKIIVGNITKKNLTNLKPNDINWAVIKNRYFPNINSKYPYHNFDEKYPELDNKIAGPPNNYYRPCYNCRAEVDLVIIPGSSAPPIPASCPNEKCNQIAYIPNTPSHQKKYIFMCLLKNIYDFALFALSLEIFFLEKNSMLDIIILSFIIFCYVESFRKSFYDCRQNIISHLNYLNVYEMERDYPVAENRVDHGVNNRNIYINWIISVTACCGIFEFIMGQSLHYLYICPKYFWFFYADLAIHQISIRMIYPIFYSYLYEQSPKNFMELEIFSYKFSGMIAIIYCILTCMFMPLITYIRKRSTTDLVMNPKISTH